jgi:mannose-6-phosphate isomerase-like protein (cupin superfamily)
MFVERPWGYYINIHGDDNSGSKVKKIVVYPGKRLSLQSHEYRSEHWIITKGNASVQLGNSIHYLTENQHIFIPVTEKHRIENNTQELLEFIEVQYGSYLGEDDIKRYEDDFGRN